MKEGVAGLLEEGQVATRKGGGRQTARGTGMDCRTVI